MCHKSGLTVEIQEPKKVASEAIRVLFVSMDVCWCGDTGLSVTHE